jgi:dTDP-4-amino-4,6-dideoxygalactose transaminase
MRVLYAQAVYGAEEVAAVTDVLTHHPLQLMGGPTVEAFEARIAALFGKRHGLMVNSGSSANLLALAALDLPRGSEVITPALTFSTTVAPLVQHGLTPAFVDVEPDTYVIDAARVEEMVGPKTRAMMVPNLIGNLPDWTALGAIARRHRLLLIEDSCDPVGYHYRGGTTGEVTDVAVTSFYASHVMTCAGFGGLVMFNDPALERRARLLRGWGAAPACSRSPSASRIASASRPTVCRTTASSCSRGSVTTSCRRRSRRRSASCSSSGCPASSRRASGTSPGSTSSLPRMPTGSGDVN